MTPSKGFYSEMAYTMTEANTLKDTNWVYHEEPRKVQYASGLLIIIAAAVLVFMLNRQNLHTVFIYQLTAAVLVMAAALSMTMNRTTLEINRREGVVTKTSQLLIFKRSRSYPLHDFHNIRLIEQIKTVEEGYLVLSYTVVLQGHKISLELLSTDDKKKGELLCKEIFSLLHLRRFFGKSETFTRTSNHKSI